MVYLSKIYTKSGDSGVTSLVGGFRVEKNSNIIRSLAALDEANSAIGLVDYSDFSSILQAVQNDLFDIGAIVAGSDKIIFCKCKIEWLEDSIDFYNKSLSELNSFVIPNNILFWARAVVRLAEIEVWDVIALENKVDRIVAVYLNRLSDLLFVLARVLTNGEERLWKDSIDK